MTWQRLKKKSISIKVWVNSKWGGRKLRFMSMEKKIEFRRIQTEKSKREIGTVKNFSSKSLNLNFKIIFLFTYIFSRISSANETRSINKEITRISAYEIWRYQKILKIKLQIINSSKRKV